MLFIVLIECILRLKARKAMNNLLNVFYFLEFISGNFLNVFKKNKNIADRRKTNLAVYGL
jgi:hypothetical protein